MTQKTDTLNRSIESAASTRAEVSLSGTAPDNSPIFSRHNMVGHGNLPPISEGGVTMPFCRVAATIFAMSILSLVGAPAWSSGREVSASRLAEIARDQLTDAHHTLVRGVLDVEAERKRVTESGSELDALMGMYRALFLKHLTSVRALEREWRSVRSTQVRRKISSFADRVNRVQMTALKLSANFSSYGMTQVREFEAKARGMSPVSSGAFACFGSIAGTVQGPSGPLGGVTVTAFTAPGEMVGNTVTLGDGSYQIDGLLAGGLYYLVTKNAEGLIDEAYSDVACPGSSCDPVIGTSVSVSLGSVTSGIDFNLSEGSRIGGTIFSLPGPSPHLSSVLITNIDGDFIASTLNDLFTGEYLLDTGLTLGSYFVVTQSFSPKLDELYDNRPCSGGAICDPVTGDPVTVVPPNDTLGVNFLLEDGGKIAGNVIATKTALPIPGILVGIHDDLGTLFTFGQTDGLGNYFNLYGLATGTYFATTSNVLGYRDELYQDLPCTGALCNITGGAGIDVVVGGTTTGVNFALEVGGRISGTVTNGVTGEPLEGVLVLIYSATGGRVDITQTNSIGEYMNITGLDTGNYYATTLNPFGFDDELYDGFQCPFGMCGDVTVGTPIAVTLDEITEGIDFDLVGGILSSCDFEECTLCELSSNP